MTTTIERTAPAAMPAATRAWILGYMKSAHCKDPFRRRVRLAFLLQWTLWSDGIESNRMPGYDTCPPDTGKGYPAGWSPSNFRRLAEVAVATR